MNERFFRRILEFGETVSLRKFAKRFGLPLHCHTEPVVREFAERSNTVTFESQGGMK